MAKMMVRGGVEEEGGDLVSLRWNVLLTSHQLLLGGCIFFKYIFLIFDILWVFVALRAVGPKCTSRPNKVGEPSVRIRFLPL